MRRRSSIALAGCLFGIAISAQTRVDFSGRWVAVQPSAASGHELRITQDASTMRLEQRRLWPEQVADTLGRVRGPAEGEYESTTYRLDGKPALAYRSGDDRRQVRSTLVWRDGSRVQLTDFYTDTGQRFQRTLTLDKTGQLILEQGLPEVSSDDPVVSSGQIARPRRIVFARR